MRNEALAIEAGLESIVTHGSPHSRAPADAATAARVSAHLPARARVAMLTLQLRAARHEADEAEARARALDDEAETARTAIQQGMEQLAAHRRQTSQEELDLARAEAAAVVEAARLGAAALVFEARQRAARVVSPRSTAAPEHGASDEVSIWAPPAASAAPAATAVSAELPSIDVPVSTAPPPEEPAEHPAPVPALPTASPTPALLDMQALASAVAAAVATAMAQARSVEPRLAIAPRRPTFRDRALHVDVLLPLVAAAIVLLVLVAWMA